MQEQETEEFRDHLSTINAQGKRRWIYPKKPRGKFYNMRLVVAAILLTFLVAAPFVRVGGNPLLMFNILERKFSILGFMFHPHDFYLFAFAMIAGIIFIGIFTLVFGRLFCGWICPQTIFMELLFRRIEYWIEGDWDAQKALEKSSGAKKVFKKTLKHTIFLAISFFISNIFLAYIIGSDELLRIITEPPSQHAAGLSIMIAFSLAFYVVFAFVREQVCTNICPYGRLQGALLDKQSMVVAYDYVRGETRGKFRKNENRTEVGKGDCVDCLQCVHVCPTGIDIRNGTQLECTNCTACIDACDSVMEKLAMPGGLIRYASEQSIREKTAFKFGPRNILFSGILLVLVGIFIVLILLRGTLEVSVLRTSGMTYVEDAGMVKNLYNYNLTNKTGDVMVVEFKIKNDQAGGTIQLIGKPTLSIEPEGKLTGSFFVSYPQGAMKGQKNDIEIEVFAAGTSAKVVEMNFIAPN